MQNMQISTSRHSPSLEDEGATSPSLHSWAISPKSLLGKAFSQTIGLAQGGPDANHTDSLSALDSWMRAEPMATDCQGLRTWRKARWIHSGKNLGSSVVFENRTDRRNLVTTGEGKLVTDVIQKSTNEDESAHCCRASDMFTLHSTHCDHSLVCTLPGKRHISEGQQTAGSQFHTIRIVGILDIPNSSKVSVDVAVESKTGKIGLDEDSFVDGGLQTLGNLFDCNSMRLLWIGAMLGG